MSRRRGRRGRRPPRIVGLEITPPGQPPNSYTEGLVLACLGAFSGYGHGPAGWGGTIFSAADLDGHWETWARDDRDWPTTSYAHRRYAEGLSAHDAVEAIERDLAAQGYGPSPVIAAWLARNRQEEQER